MHWANSGTRYGMITKFFHWAVFLLFVNQYVVARLMLTTPIGATSLGYTQGQLYNWHKSIGLILLALALLRYTWRRTTRLPDWAATLSAGEKQLIHWLERVLYFCDCHAPERLFLCHGGRLRRQLYRTVAVAQHHRQT
ncbi:MAG: cytochrome b/b6 domain-containing protein [Caldilineaceae bacterium]